MYRDAKRTAWTEIDLKALDHNIKAIRQKVNSGTSITAVVKADAYGHGAVRITERLRENGVDTFAVATLDEAIELREAGINDCSIVLLGLTSDLYSDLISEYDITPVVDDYENANAISEAAIRAGKTIEGYIAADTGMGRIGYLTNDPDAVADIKKISTLKGFRIKGLFSHLATADQADKTYALKQESWFNKFYESLTDAGISIPSRVLGNSAAVMDMPSAHLDVVRPGIILYGCYPSPEMDRAALDIIPVMSVKANIIKLKKVPADFSVGYGRKFISKRESLIATIALGYADGYPRPYSMKGKVIINGTVAPLAGNICMDQCMIDVTDVPGVRKGDEVTVMGSNGGHHILADDIADATDTINYEIVCAFGQRLPKVYKG